MSALGIPKGYVAVTPAAFRHLEERAAALGGSFTHIEHFHVADDRYRHVGKPIFVKRLYVNRDDMMRILVHAAALASQG